MGIHISIVTADGKNHPDWDFCRMSGDRDFTTWMKGLPEVMAQGDELFRPVDIAQWRAALPPDRPNPDRFPQMFDILERCPDYWISISY